MSELPDISDLSDIPYPSASCSKELCAHIGSVDNAGFYVTLLLLIDVAGELAHTADMEHKQVPPPVEAPAVSQPTSAPRHEDVAKIMAEIFYNRVTKRQDIRELLTRLAKK